MDYSRYEKLRALVRGSFSSETQRLVDDALAYADEQLAGMTRSTAPRCSSTARE